MSQARSGSEGMSGERAEIAPPLQGEYRRSRQHHGAPIGRTPFVPLLIFFLAAVAWSGFQFQQLLLESETLALLRGNQEAQVEQAQKVRATLDTLALETQKLADGGNANARLVVDELRKRGITINRPAGERKK